jgi:hypothetical protein
LTPGAIPHDDDCNGGEEEVPMALADFEDALNNTDEVDLTTTGRSSGRERSCPVWFVRQEETLFLLPVTGSDSQWYRNVLGTPDIRLSAAGTEYRTRATPITDPDEVDRVVDMFRARFGSGVVEAYYPKHDVAVEVRLS